MIEPPQALRAVSERVIEQRATAGAEATGAARAFAELELVMTSLIGAGGYRALENRAVHVTREQVAEIASLELPLAFPKDGWTLVQSAAGPEQVRRCACVLLVNLLGLLCQFIGEDLTYRLVRRAWPDLRHGEPDPNPGDL